MEMFLRVGLGNAAAAGLLALGAASVGVFLQRRPALRHGLWLLVLLKLITPPLWTVPVTWGVGPVAVAVAARAERSPEGAPARPPDDGRARAEDVPEPGLLLEDGAARGAGTRDEPVPAVGGPPAHPGMPWGWPVVVVASWVGGSLLTFGVAAWRIRQFRRLLGLAEPASEATRAQVVALAGRLGLGPAPGVWRVPGAVSPMLWALGGRPRLLVPSALWDRLDERHRATLLTHELAHLRRRDHWVRGLELLVTGLYWWFPVVWIARHALREAEEQCCDAWVVWAFPDATRTYAEALLKTVDFLSGAGPAVAVAASGLGPVHHLKRRMTMILQGTTPRALTRGGLLAVLGLSATLLPLSPTWAQRPDDTDQEAPASAPEKPETRDPGPRPEPPLVPGPRPAPRAFRGSKEEDPEGRSKEAMGKALFHLGFAQDEAGWMSPESRNELREAMAQVQATLRAISDRNPGKPFDVRDREALEQAVQRLRHVMNQGRVSGLYAVKGEREQGRPEAERDTSKARDVRERTERRTQEAEERGLAPAPRPRTPKAVRDEREADERRDEVKRLKAEVESRRKALIESEMRLARAIKRQAETGEAPGVDARKERFKVRVIKPGQGPYQPGASIFIPKPGQEMRIAELEERLEKLQDEVKSLKKVKAPNFETRDAPTQP